MAVALSHYETLYWINRLGTFRAAADLLSVSQPTVSLRMRELERELAVQLFERSGRLSVLTEDGRVAADYAGRILALSQDLNFRIRRPERLHGTLRLGIPDALAIVYLPSILLELERQHPELSLSVTVESSDALSRRLMSGSVDAAVIVGPLPPDSVRQYPLATNRPIWVASEKFLRPDREYRPADLAHRRIFTSKAPSTMHAMITAWFNMEAAMPMNLSSCNSVATILSLTEAGACLGLLPYVLVAEKIEAGRLFALRTPHQAPMETIFFSVPRISTNPAAPIVHSIAKVVFGASSQDSAISEDTGRQTEEIQGL